ncbi:MAG: beta-ketoacyl-[acyl-carrier-protein] synthase family protein [Verrucomicrobiae bacterium]|nr:beta-ketoacyl-[acyl-carrier-protein] synthase family protein [Verrucomicrobiae bacterium]
MLFQAGQCSTSAARVVITGAGIITALGRGWQANAAGFRRGKPAFRPVSLFDVSRQRAKTAAEVELPMSEPPPGIHPHEWRRWDRANHLLYHAAREAWEQAGWEKHQPITMVLGTTSAGMGRGEEYFRHALTHPRNFRAQAGRGLHYQAQRQALNVQRALGFHGPTIFIANACASGANAIGHAFDLIRWGLAERVFAGGYDALSQLVFCGFDSLQSLSLTQCRPFDRRRDGLALGEGAAVLALESEMHARQRGGEILGEIAGYGAATDIHHLTQPHPQGEAALQAMQEATAMAGLRPEQVSYINAHGTGTPLNDSAEAAAIQRWAASQQAIPPVSSTKGVIGHLLGGAGAVEAVVCLMALREQWLPPNAGWEVPDPACALPIVNQPQEAVLEYALSNSFGFGGANATLILRRRP